MTTLQLLTILGIIVGAIALFFVISTAILIFNTIRGRYLKKK